MAQFICQNYTILFNIYCRISLAAEKHVEQGRTQDFLLRDVNFFENMNYLRFWHSQNCYKSKRKAALLIFQTEKFLRASKQTKFLTFLIF